MHFENDFIHWIGYVAGCLTVASFIPQTLKTFQTKNVSGLSLTMYTLFNIGEICWIIYGFIRGSYPLIIFNSITFLFAFPVLLMILKYRQRPENQSRP